MMLNRYKRDGLIVLGFAAVIALTGGLLFREGVKYDNQWDEALREMTTR